MSDTPTQQQPAPELLPCPWCGATPLIFDHSIADVKDEWSVYCKGEMCAVAPSTTGEFKQHAISQWNNQTIARVRADVVTPVSYGISWSALLAVLERLRSKNRNPENQWYHGWNAAIQCLINDVNARSNAKASPTVAGATESPILAFEAWLLRWVKDHGRKLTQTEYGIAYTAFIAAHPGEGPHASIMAATAAPSSLREADLINRQEVIDWLADRCDHAPPCGNCIYCQVSYAISVWTPAKTVVVPREDVEGGK